MQKLAMEKQNFEFIDNKVIIRIRDTVCENTNELLNSALFREFLQRGLDELKKRNSYLLGIFGKREINDAVVDELIRCLMVLAQEDDGNRGAEMKRYNDLLKDPALFNDFVEFMYNSWRGYDRFIFCDGTGRDWDKRPYRTFNATVGHLTGLVRGLYRDVQEAVMGIHPRIYRQVSAGAEMATISVSQAAPLKDPKYAALSSISMIRQVLLNPPLILNPPMNKRKGHFIRIEKNPFDVIDLQAGDWLCYPAKVGPLLILIYIHKRFIDLGLSLCNLFQLADDKDLQQKPDAIYFFGVPGDALNSLAEFPTVFYEDTKNDILVAAVPNRNEFGYFGYLKKMVLTLHNIIMMKRGRWPYHGALVKLNLKNNKSSTILFIGDTGAGKSETLEALREIGHTDIQDIFIIADDMGSIEIGKKGEIIGYGTEIGAFLRLDDLQPGYALGQIDRAIIMSANQINARIILPVTTFDTLIKGHAIDYIFYANNYEEIDEEHPIIERFANVQDAFHVFREGTVMSKGTTASTGIVHSYFANIFGPVQYKELHDKIARQYFEQFFKANVFVGQMRTRLGLNGFERRGPEEAAKKLLEVIQSNH